jgi:hypothetical protein
MSVFPHRQVAMQLRSERSVRRTSAALCAISLATLTTLTSCGGNACIGLNGCGGAVVTDTLAISGTAAIGKPLASATVSVDCAQGSGSALSDGGGHYSISMNASPPCILSVSSGNTVLHSLAFASGTFNVTPETDLLVTYLAAQLGTNEAGLIAGSRSNPRFQQALADPNDGLAAQSAIVANLQQHYALTLASPAFLTTPFNVGQAGIDSDLQALAKAGAVDANGMPEPAAVSLMSAAGSAHPLAGTATSAPASSSSPGSGGTGSSTGGMM